MSTERGTPVATLARNRKIIVCFAVREEAKYFQPPRPNCDAVISGIGQANARHALLKSIESDSPRLVLTCGYAGGLNPRFKRSDILFDSDSEYALPTTLARLGALPGKFHCANRIITTVSEKETQWRKTGADAVEMESGVIRDLCRERDIPSATIRVISDDASQNLPLDFNTIASSDGNMSYLKLAGALVRSPSLIPKLMRFQRELEVCSRALGGVLNGLIATLDE